MLLENKLGMLNKNSKNNKFGKKLPSTLIKNRRNIAMRSCMRQDTSIIETESIAATPRHNTKKVDNKKQRRRHVSSESKSSNASSK